MSYHPIQPTKKLVDQWVSELTQASIGTQPITMRLALKAAAWGADQELQQCCNYIAGDGRWFCNPAYRIIELQTARRPRPPSIKQLALKALTTGCFPSDDEFSTIQHALEALPDD